MGQADAIIDGRLVEFKTTAPRPVTFDWWDLLQTIIWAGFILVGAYWCGIGF